MPRNVLVYILNWEELTKTNKTKQDKQIKKPNLFL